MNLLKNTKGITLITLIVTIIILLILAGVTLNLLTGENGILKQATNAVDNYSDAAEKELSDLKNLDQFIDSFSNKKHNTPQTDLTLQNINLYF